MTLDKGAQIVSPKVRLREDSLGAFVLHVTFAAGGEAAFAALGDGTLAVGSPAALASGESKRIPLGAACTAAALDADGMALLVGGDDGCLLRVSGDGDIEELLGSVPGWIESVAVHPASGKRAAAQGRTVRVLDAAGAVVAMFADHPSTPGGLAFSPDGRQLAIAHYDGVTVWNLESGERDHKLYWHGSHTGIAWSPDGRFIVTAMQDKEIHCWLMPEGKGMRMSGYPAKIRSLSWTADSSFVAASGADTVTSWYCPEGGPAGRAPLEFGYVFNGVVTRVAAHPRERRVAGGYNEGTVLIGEIETGDAIIARTPGGGGISALAWSPDGRFLLAGTESGALTLIESAAAVG